MKAKSFLLALCFVLSVVVTQSFAQTYWQDDGISIRQGTHLGWNGCAISAGNDMAIFYYHAKRDGTRDVYGQRIESDGSYRWNNNGILISGNISEQRAPVAATYSDGSTLVVWEDYAHGRYRDLVAQRYDISGNPMWTPAEGVPIITAAHDQYDPKIALDEQDYAFLTFVDDRLTHEADVSLGVYAQILTPTGQTIGPDDGIKLVDRLEIYNEPHGIVCHEHTAYILCSVMNGGSFEIVLQKLLADGTVAWPEDSVLAVAGDFGEKHLSKIPGGLAFSWCDRTNDSFGDARLMAVNYDRELFAGWPSNGIEIAAGPGIQFVHRLDLAPNNDILAATANDDFDSDINLTLSRYNLSAQMVGEPAALGQAALESSPVDLCWDGNNAIVTWVNRDDYYNHTVLVQKFSPLNERLWSENDHQIFSREAKILRSDIEKPANAPARILLLTGRSITQPETLFIGSLNDSGNLANTETFSAGITSDIFDPRVARIADNRFAVIWSDSRRTTGRDIYYQFVNGEGQSLLNPEGSLVSEGDLSIQYPPAVCGDGTGGAYLAWMGDSLGQHSILKIQRILSNGLPVWTNLPRIYSNSGFHGDIFLIPDNTGGVFVAYSKFNDAFVTRPNIARINSNGEFVWTPNIVEFEGSAGTDLTISSAIADGENGIVLACESGVWTNVNISIFHLDQNGIPGGAWTQNGFTWGTSLQERHPQLAQVGDELLLTYESEISSGGMSRIVGVAYAANGEAIWQQNPKQFTTADARVFRYQLSADGSNGFLLAWEDFRNGQYNRSYAARYDHDGNPLWSNTERLVCDLDREITGTTLTHDNSGGAWIMWEDYRNSDDYAEIDLFATHLDGETGSPVTANGFSWPSDGYPICDVPTYARNPVLFPWQNGSALAVWIDLRSSNPGRCCGAGAVGDIFQNIYGQILSEYSLSSEPPHAVIPETFGIQSVYPNPFNPETKIQFSLPQNSFIELSIYNLLGQKTATLISQNLTAGIHEISWNAESNSSGIYFAKLETMNQTSVKKLVVMK